MIVPELEFWGSDASTRSCERDVDKRYRLLLPSSESQCETDPSDRRLHEDLTPTPNSSREVFKLKQRRIEPLQTPRSLQSQCIQSILRKMSCFHRLLELQLYLPPPVLRTLYREGIRYSPQKDLGGPQLPNPHPKGMLPMSSDPAEFPTQNIFTEQDVYFSKRFCTSFRYNDLRYKTFRSYCYRQGIVVIVNFCFHIQRLKLRLCCHCMKLHCLYSRPSQPKTIRREYWYSYNFYDMAAWPELWCVGCHQVPLFQLLDRETMYRKHGQRVSRSLPHTVIHTPYSKRYKHLKTEHFRGALEKQYDYFLQKYPHIFKYVTVSSRPATHQDYYVPATLAHECQVYSVAFNEAGCRKIGCFPKTNTLRDCTAQDPTEYVAIGDQFFLACQPACHQLSPFIDTEFRDGKCWQTNTEKKIFALFPEKIHGVEIYQPMHGGLSLRDGDLVINPDYCTAFGLSFDRGECLAPIGQEIAEFFLGSTVFKSLKKLTIPAVFNAAATPAVPDDVRTVDNWLEGSASQQQGQAAYAANSSMPYIPDQTVSQTIREFMKDLAIDASVDVSLDYSLHVMKKRIPQSILKFSSTGVNRKLAQSALMKTITQSQALTAARVARGLFSTLSKVNVVMSVFGILSNVVDMFDPFNYNYVLDKETLSRVNEHLDFTFYKSNDRRVEMTPEKIWNVLEDDMSIYIETLEEKMDVYLAAVQLEDAHARTHLQKDLYNLKKIKKAYNWQKVFHVFFVMVLVVASILFLHYIAYFLLVYFIFILASPPSFY